MSGLFRQETLDSHKERLWGDVVLIQPLSFYLISGFITAIVLSVVLFLVYGTYARRENVSGYLTPDKGLVKIYATSSGLISNIHASEGQQVKKGDLLFNISTQKTVDQKNDIDALLLDKIKKNKSNIQKKLKEQKRLTKHENLQFNDQIRGLKKEVSQIRSLIKTHTDKYKISEKQLNNLNQLLSKNYLNKSEYISKQEHLVDIKLQLEETRQQLNTKQNQLTEAQNLLSQLPIKSAIKISELNQQQTDIDQKIIEMGGRRTYALRAPASGRVTAIQAYPGSRVREDRPLLTILPIDAEFKAELFIPTRAIGFIETGQTVLLRYNAFPYQRYGLYEGTIDNVSEVILSPEELHVPVKLEEPAYRVSVTLNKQEISAYGKQFNLQAGMLLEASIVLEGRSLGEWLLAPIYSLRGRV
jgi:membrane fusion protein